MALLNWGGGSSTPPSVILDPFKTENITGVSIHGSKKIFGGEWYWYGTVSFRNGNTSGEQRTKDHAGFDTLMTEIKQIMQSIK